MTARFVFAMILLLSTTTAGVAGIRGELDPVNHAGRQPSAMCGDRFREVKVAGPDCATCCLEISISPGQSSWRFHVM